MSTRADAFYLTILFTLSYLIASHSAFAQVPDTMWTRIYGGAAPDAGYDLEQLPDRGFILAGETQSFGQGGRDMLLIRTDSAGDTLWRRTFGGGKEDYGRAVLQTFPDSGFIIIGTTFSFGPGRADVFVVKTDEQGDTLWMKALGRTGVHDYGTAIHQTVDGGYIICGHAIPVWSGDYDILLMRTDASGDTLWTRSYGDASRQDYAHCVKQTADGGFVVAGRSVTMDGSDDDILLIRTYEDGEVRWERRYGGSGEDYCMSFEQATDGGFILTGYTTSTGHGLADLYLLKTDGIGGLRWQRTHGGALGDYGFDVRRTPDGGYIVAGETYSFGEGQGDVYIVKTDSKGRLVWTRTYGCDGSDAARSLTGTSDGGYAVVGRTRCFGAGQFALLLLRMGPPPADSVAPCISLGIFQNPYLSRYLDICLVADEALDSASVAMTVGEVAIPVRSTSYEKHIFVGDYRVAPPGGILSLSVTAEDLAGNDTTVTAEFSCMCVAAAAGGRVVSPDGIFNMSMEGAVLSGDTYVLVTPHVAAEDDLSPEGEPLAGASLALSGSRPAAYRVGPCGIIRTGEVAVEFAYPDRHEGAGGNPDRFYIYNSKTGPLRSCIDPERDVVTASSTELGLFMLACGAPGTSPVLDPFFFDLRDPCPNPTQSGAAIGFEIRSPGRICIDVYDIRGRHITCLLDVLKQPGFHMISWDGRSDSGRRVAGGVYLIKASNGHTASTCKVTVLR